MLGFAGAFRQSQVIALNVEDLEFCYEGVRVTIRRLGVEKIRTGVADRYGAVL